MGDERGVYTALAVRRWIDELMRENKGFVLLHELKTVVPSGLRYAAKWNFCGKRIKRCCEMKFEDVFHVKKPVMAMLHLKGKTHEEVLQRTNGRQICCSALVQTPSLWKIISGTSRTLWPFWNGFKKKGRMPCTV